ncbi:hypothetical protein JCM5296_006394 [Sporobolomyces johnsonii]
MAPPSTADPDNSSKDYILDKLWPLSRFVGYRPPPSPGPGDTSSFVDHLLPQPLRDRSRKRRARRNGGKGSNLVVVESGNGRGEVDKGKKPEEEEGEPSWGKKAGDKLFDMFLTLIGSFGGIAFLALASRSSVFYARHAPIVIGSFGAEAVLLYAAPTSPLTQPRCVIIGNAVSAVLGTGVAKLFLLMDGFTVGQVEGPNWAAAACALSLSLLAMQFLEITHPPGGATALLAVTIPQVSQLSWFYVVDILVSSLIMLGWALVVNNLGGRRYPTEWFWKSRWIIL